MQQSSKSNTIKIITIILGIFILSVTSFSTGLFVGLHKAKFSYEWGKHYEKNFMFPRGGPGGGFRKHMRDIQGKGFRNPHGVAGTIISIADNILVIKDKDEQENTISVSETTLIKKRKDTLAINELKENDKVVILGKPNEEGVVSAALIRVFNK